MLDFIMYSCIVYCRGVKSLDAKNRKLRIIWLIPNVFMYLVFLGFGGFVLLHWDELRGINELGYWVIRLLLVLVVALFGSYRIWSWIRQGKM